jgi:hypothetical protein
MTEPTYELHAVRGRTAIFCRLCDRISELPGDVEQRYCSRCHLFHDAIADGRELIAAGGTHDCGEWATYRQVCALCGAVLTAAAADAPLLAAFTAELQSKTQPMELVLVAASVVQLAALVQLALRHPALRGDPREAGERFLAGVRAYFADAPHVLDVLRRGDEPAHDIPWT